MLSLEIFRSFRRLWKLVFLALKSCNGYVVGLLWRTVTVIKTAHEQYNQEKAFALYGGTASEALMWVCT